MVKSVIIIKTSWDCNKAFNCQEAECSFRKAVMPRTTLSAGRTRVCVDTSGPQCSCYCSQRHSLACWLVMVGTTGNGIMP
ncbi:uncharacterized [Tachysurus ichikawai]